MMTLNERLEWLLLGMAIGYVISRIRDIARYLQEIKAKVDEVDEIVVKGRDEKGFMRHPIIADMCMIVALVLTVWAAVVSGRAASKVQDNQFTTEKVVYCTHQFLSKTLSGLNIRTKYTQDRATANVALQRKQVQLLTILLVNPPKSDAQQRQALNSYFRSLNEFVSASESAAKNIKNDPFPTNKGLSKCLNSSRVPSIQK